MCCDELGLSRSSESREEHEPTKEPKILIRSDGTCTSFFPVHAIFSEALRWTGFFEIKPEAWKVIGISRPQEKDDDRDQP